MKNLLLCGTATLAIVAATSSWADDDRDGHHRPTSLTISYVADSLKQSTIKFGPWTLHEKDAQQQHDASGIVPTTAGPPYTGSGTPCAGYCNASGQAVSNLSVSLMQPYYFPFVRRRHDVLEGFFDYRPRNQQEATVAAISTDWGVTWHFQGEALALNPYCPADATDPDNLNVIVNGISVAYGSSSANAADNGLGHPVVLSFGGVERLYTLNRANGHIDSDPLVVHALNRSEDENPLQGVPQYGYVSPLASGGYPTLTSGALATSGLQNPDAILGAVRTGSTTTVVYVEKTLNADTTFPSSQICPKTPNFALTNLINGKARKANDDVIAIRVASTMDGITFTDVGAATGLNDPTTVALNGIRYLGSGSLIRLADGRYGMFFGAGNCLDNDSDGFHFIGYAETDAPVRLPSDLLKWHVINGLDNPILSTDTVTDPSGPRPYRDRGGPTDDGTSRPVHTSSTKASADHSAGRVRLQLFQRPGLRSASDLTIVFAGYNTPQPSNNLGDYRTIGRFQLRFPEGYIARGSDGRDRD